MSFLAPPESACAQKRAAALAILQQPDVLNALLILIDDGISPLFQPEREQQPPNENIQPRPEREQPPPDEKLNRKSIRKIVYKLMIRPSVRHNVATITLIWTILGVFMVYVSNTP